MPPSCIAFVPARAGSKRVPDKNIRPIGGHPLLAYTIAAARDSGVFDAVYCATDSAQYAEIARHYGAEVPFLRDPAISGDKAPDIEWVRWILGRLAEAGLGADCFSILRPTSPFRQADTIRRAWAAFLADPAADSLRAIEKCGQHPGKMWVVRGGRMQPILPYHTGDTPWHSSQYAALPEIWVQNASLEIAWTRVARDGGSIAGDSIIPFVSEGLEGFDINQPEDWMLAEHYISTGVARLPAIGQQPWQPKN
jgi:N-acylneuraminate cytidylyltransferase